MGQNLCTICSKRELKGHVNNIQTNQDNTEMLELQVQPFNRQLKIDDFSELREALYRSPVEKNNTKTKKEVRKVRRMKSQVTESNSTISPERQGQHYPKSETRVKEEDSPY